MKGCLFRTEDWRFLNDLVKGQLVDVEALSAPTYIKTAVENHLKSIELALAKALDVDAETGNAQINESL